MSEQNQDPEPSMEEILASIRRIISEDGEEEADSVGGSESGPDGEEEADSVGGSESGPDGAAPADEDVLELTEEVEEEESTMNDRPRKSRGGGLVSPKTETAAAGAFSALAAANPQITDAIKIGNGTRTLEEMVKEVLRPVLKEWLDENLSKLVEKMVQAEIRRLSNDS